MGLVCGTMVGLRELPCWMIVIAGGAREVEWSGGGA